MPDRLRALNVASCEMDVIVTVAEPINTPPWVAVIVTVSASSSSSSSSPSISSAAEDSPAGRVSLSDLGFTL